MSADRIFLDTNVIVYRVDAREPEKRAAALKRIADERAARSIVVSTQVLQELYVALTRGKHPIASSEIAEQVVREIAVTSTVVHVDVTLILSAIAAAKKHQISFWDGLILRSAAEAGCDVVLSEDLNPGQSYDGVRVENPFS